MIALSDAASAIVNTVHAKADMVGDSVYSLASIPVPATPAPRPAPGAPTDFTVTPNNNGSITLTWSCANPGTAGARYQVWRRIAGEAGWTGRGARGRKEHTDATMPAGSKTVSYQIQATRTTGGGPFAQFNVNFGVDTGGGATATVVAGPTSPKMAA